MCPIEELAAINDHSRPITLFFEHLDEIREVGQGVRRFECGLSSFDWICCVSAWNKDPIFGVIGVQSGPPH